jgi:hypothetical protein
MTEHPITPPPELVKQWRSEPEYSDGHHKITMVTMSQDRLMEICRKSALYGADQELEACCEWLVSEGWFKYEHEAVEDLRTARRPKSPSLKEQALAALDDAIMRGDCITISDALPTIRRALEALPND